MYDLPATLDRSPAPVLDCKFARTCIYLSFKGLNLRQKLTFEQKCEKVTCVSVLNKPEGLSFDDQVRYLPNYHVLRQSNKPIV